MGRLTSHDALISAIANQTNTKQHSNTFGEARDHAAPSLGHTLGHLRRQILEGLLELVHRDSGGGL
jgi:hypothetical protein